jgi:hypothetical protein
MYYRVSNNLYYRDYKKIIKEFFVWYFKVLFQGSVVDLLLHFRYSNK